MPDWDQQGPIYQQLADLLAARLLDGDPPEGQPMPSVRALAAQLPAQPADGATARCRRWATTGLLENRRGLGLYVTPGARERLQRRRTPSVS